MPEEERKRAEKCKHSELREEGDVFLGNEVTSWNRVSISKKCYED